MGKKRCDEVAGSILQDVMLQFLDMLDVCLGGFWARQPGNVSNFSQPSKPGGKPGLLANGNDWAMMPAWTLNLGKGFFILLDVCLSCFPHRPATLVLKCGWCALMVVADSGFAGHLNLFSFGGSLLPSTAARH